MATSGTTSFTLDLSDIMEEAYERAGLELRSGYDYKTARRSLDLLMLEWQNRGLNLWTVRNTSQALTAGTSSYDLSADKLDIIEGLLRTDAGNTSKQSDLTMQRISVSQYAHQTNKLTQGRPLQYYVERKPTGVTVHFWPVPDATQSYTFEYYYMERIEDTGSPHQTTWMCRQDSCLVWCRDLPTKLPASGQNLCRWLRCSSRCMRSSGLWRLILLAKKRPCIWLPVGITTYE